MRRALLACLPAFLCASCATGLAPVAPNAVKPRVVTQRVRHDTDDPAIWINPANPALSLVVGTDKETDGALYAFDLAGKIVRVARDLQRPNNVDIVYGLMLGGKPVDVAVVTERERQRLRIYRLPELTLVDRGDLAVFVGETERLPMGIGLYKRPADSAIFAVVGRKSGPADGYLWQYRLEDDGTGMVRMTKVRQFGRYSGKKEIESIAVDSELGYLYYSDEGEGVHKYLADPDAPGAERELALFATTGFVQDHEGISIYRVDATTGYIVVSDQQGNRFQIFTREGEPGNPHEHRLLKTVPVSAIESDGSDVTSADLGPKFPGGLFVAMSNGRVFHYYAWQDLFGSGSARIIAAGGRR